MRRHTDLLRCCLFLLMGFTCHAQTPDAPRILLVHHSIEYAARIDRSHWTLGGSASATGSQLILSPESPGHQGHLWATTPIVTDSFQLEFFFEVAPPFGRAKSDSQRPEGFAIWYSPHTFQNDLAGRPGLFGMAPQFTGLAVFFKMHDRSGAVNPSISAAVSDGQRQWDMAGDVPSDSGVYWKPIDGTEPVMFRLTVSPSSVMGEARLVASAAWTEVFKIEASLPESGYLGFSADSGRRSDSVEKILLWDIKTFNLNLKVPGEISAPWVHEGVKKLVDAAAVGADSYESLKTISQLMIKLVAEVIPRQEQISRILQMLELQTAHLSADLTDIQDHLGAPHAHKNEIESIKSQITGLRELVGAHSELQAKATQKLIEVGKNIHDKDTIVHGRHMEKIHGHLSRQAKLNWVMFAGFSALVLGLVGIVWKKTRDLEKKHLF